MPPKSLITGGFAKSLITEGGSQKKLITGVAQKIPVDSPYYLNGVALYPELSTPTQEFLQLQVRNCKQCLILH